MASSAPSSPLRQLFEDRLSQLSTEVEALFGDARERARRDLTEHLNGAVRRLRQAADVEELASTLVDAAGAFAAGAAFFRIEGRTARGERIRGVSEERAGRFAGTRIALDGAAALAGAVESRDPVTAAATASEVSPEMLEIAPPPQDLRVSIFPIVARDEARALLYTWGEVQVAATELLCQVAAAVWAGMEPVQVAAPAPALVRIEGAAASARPTWETLAPEEQQVHLKAQRFARVQVAEMRLRESQAVQSGRARRDLYGAIQRPIDAARTKFRDMFFTGCPSMVDYLHLELLRTLANDDADLLGKDYPGPMV